MIKITEFKVIWQFVNDTRIYGIYQCKVNGIFRLFTRNGSTFKVLVSYYDHDELENVTEEVVEAIWEELAKLADGRESHN